MPEAAGLLGRLYRRANEAAWIRWVEGGDAGRLDDDTRGIVLALLELEPCRPERLPAGLRSYWAEVSLALLLSAPRSGHDVKEDVGRLMIHHGFQSIEEYLRSRDPGPGVDILDRARAMAGWARFLATGQLDETLPQQGNRRALRTAAEKALIRTGLGSAGRCLCRLSTGEVVVVLEASLDDAEKYLVLAHEEGHASFWRGFVAAGGHGDDAALPGAALASEVAAFEAEHAAVLAPPDLTITAADPVEVRRRQLAVTQRIAAEFLATYRELGGRLADEAGEVLGVSHGAQGTGRPSSRHLDRFVLKATALLGLRAPGESAGQGDER